MNRRQMTLMMSATAFAPATPLFAQDPLAAAVNNPNRSPESKARDPFRKPAQTLAFWGLKPNMTVVEISPGGGYWTEILAPYAKATGGKYIATVSANAQAAQAFKARFADQTKWGTPEYAPFGGASGPLGPQGSADMVITARNIHNWMWTPGMLDQSLRAFHMVLKPGGILAVEEHRADPRPMVNEARDGYVSTAAVVEAAQRAGFKLEAASEINANPKDTKDHPFGVWTLPPVRRSSEPNKAAPANFDRARYDAVGESDRMTLRFRKA